MPITFPIPRKATAKLEDKIVLNDKFTQFMFELLEPAELPFLSGQYISLKVSEKGERRAYSVCSSPVVHHGFELLVDLSPGGVGSQFLAGLDFGQTVEVLGPMGRFILDEVNLNEEPALVFIATGSGIAPFYSMIQDLLQLRRDTRPIVLYWGMRYESELFWEIEFEELMRLFPNFSFHPVLSKSKEDWPLCRGRVTDCMNAHGVLQPAGYYLCGGKAMIEDMSNLLKASGLNEKRIHHEKFY